MRGRASSTKTESMNDIVAAVFAKNRLSYSASMLYSGNPRLKDTRRVRSRGGANDGMRDDWEKS